MRGRTGLARRRDALIAILTALLLIPLTALPATASVPAGFEDVVVADVNGPTDMAWTPDGRMLVTAKNGQVWVIKNGTLLSTPALDLASVMCTNGERALGSVAVHPEFATNGFVYVYYTFRKFGTCNESQVDGPVNRLSRFTMRGDTIDRSTEQVLLDTSPLYKDHHNGGDMVFAGDGYLYVTIGDGGAQSLGRPRDPGYLLGKVVRVTDTGGIPPGNAHSGPGTARCNVAGVPPTGSPAGTKCQEVYAQGLRNPFRFALDTNSPTPRFYINDVGQHSYEEISELTAPGTDFGWPAREGPCVFGSPTSCAPPPAGLTDPVHWYAHGVDGGAATAGVFVPRGVWPAQYDGAYLFADYVFGAIYRLVPNAGENRSVTPPRSRFDAPVWAAIPRVVSMAFGPHNGGQSLYYVTREGDGVHRIDYVGSANRAPVAVASADRTSGPLPLTVQFDGTASSDPDNDTLTYAWDFDGNGSTDSTSATASHTYSSGGSYTARLTVRDPSGATASDTVRIDPGGSAPTPRILVPAEGATFTVGEQIVLSGSASDPDETLGDSALSWEVRQHHATHFHPFLDATTGNDIPIVAPEPEDLSAATNSYLEVRLTATDSSGVSTTVSRVVQPEKVDLQFQTVPSGRTVKLDGTNVTGPQTVVSWVGHSLGAEAPDQVDSSGTPWAWESWSDGGARNHAIQVTGPATYTATFTEGVADRLEFTPTDDATVRQDRPDRRVGLDPVVEGDSSPVKDGLFLFDVAGLGSRPVTSATLRLFVTNSSPVGGTLRTTTDTSWQEETVTWNTAPAADATNVVGEVGPVSSGQWVDVDVTSAVRGDGPLSLRLSSTSANGVDYASLQDPGGRTPTLVVLAGAAGGPDTEAPTPPATLTAVADTPTEIELRWTQSVDDVGVAGYDIYRCDGQPSPWGLPCDTLLVSVGDVLAYEDKSVSPGQTYTYEVRARDAAGNVSTESNAATATTPAADTTPPSAPKDLVATAAGPAKVDLSWTAAVDETEMGRTDVYRDGALVGTVNGLTRTYSDTTVKPGTRYAYHLLAYDTSGNESAPSNTAQVDTPASPSRLVVPVAKDATVREDRPDRNYGAGVEVEGDFGPSRDGLLAFTLPDLGGQTVRSAKIRLFVTNSSPVGGAFSTVTGAWNEGAVTWRTAPAPQTAVGSIGNVSRDTWVELDVTSAVTTATGELALRFSSTNANGVGYQSKEGGPNSAQLVIELG